MKLLKIVFVFIAFGAIVCAVFLYLERLHTVAVKEFKIDRLRWVGSEIIATKEHFISSESDDISDDQRMVSRFNFELGLSVASDEMFHLLKYFDDALPPPKLLYVSAYQYDGLEGIIYLHINYLEGNPNMDRVNINFVDNTISWKDITYYSDLRQQKKYRSSTSVPLEEIGFKHWWFFVLYTKDQKDNVESFMLPFMRMGGGRDRFAIEITEIEMKEILHSLATANAVFSDGTRSSTVPVRVFPVKLPLPSYLGIKNKDQEDS